MKILDWEEIKKLSKNTTQTVYNDGIGMSWHINIRNSFSQAVVIDLFKKGWGVFYEGEHNTIYQIPNIYINENYYLIINRNNKTIYLDKSAKQIIFTNGYNFEKTFL